MEYICHQILVLRGPLDKSNSRTWARHRLGNCGYGLLPPSWHQPSKRRNCYASASMTILVPRGWWKTNNILTVCSLVTATDNDFGVFQFYPPVESCIQKIMLDDIYRWMHALVVCTLHALLIERWRRIHGVGLCRFRLWMVRTQCFGPNITGLSKGLFGFIVLIHLYQG